MNDKKNVVSYSKAFAKRIHICCWIVFFSFFVAAVQRDVFRRKLDPFCYFHKYHKFSWTSLETFLWQQKHFPSTCIIFPYWNHIFHRIIFNVLIRSTIEFTEIWLET